MQQNENDIKTFFGKIANGDKLAFNALFRMQYEKLLRFSKNYLPAEQAEEIVSDTFVWVWMHREMLHEIENPDTYLYVSVKNRCLNALRNRPKIVPIDGIQIPNQQQSDRNPFTDMEQKELTEKLYSVIERLPEQQKIVFKMIKENGLTARQVAEILKLSPRTVETHLYKAVKQLEEEISHYLGYSPKKKQMRQLLLLL